MINSKDGRGNAGWRLKNGTVVVLVVSVKRKNFAVQKDSQIHTNVAPLLTGKDTQ